MVILPAIDLLDGKVVRLAQGKRDRVTVYADDPVAVARRWAEAGAQWLHVVDLNGAFDGTDVNLPFARRILETKACEDPAFVKAAVLRYGAKVAVAIDAKAGQVVSRGWVAATPLTPSRLASEMAALGVRMLICTDVSRDGMLQGPNVTLLGEVLDAVSVQVIASGGISSVDDLRRLKTLEPRGVAGAIVGKALYEGTIDLQEALQAVGPV